MKLAAEVTFSGGVGDGEGVAVGVGLGDGTGVGVGVGDGVDVGIAAFKWAVNWSISTPTSFPSLAAR